MSLAVVTDFQGNSDLSRELYKEKKRSLFIKKRRGCSGFKSTHSTVAILTFSS